MKVKDTWNLNLLYKSDKDPQIEKDLKMIEAAYAAFEKKYKGKPFTQSPAALAKALSELESLREKLSKRNPWWYFALKIDLNSNDSASAARATQYEQRLTEASNKTKFFGLEIAKILPKDQKKFLTASSLKPYVYFLGKVFKHAKYNLTEGEEQLEDLLSQTSYTMWVDAQEKLLNQQSIQHKGEALPLPKAMKLLSSLPKKDRREIHSKINQTLKSVSHLAEAELNAVYNYKKIMDKRRGYEKPYSATILGYQNDEKAIEKFVALVTKHFKIAHRFYKVHAKLLVEKKITRADRMARIGEIKKRFDFSSAVNLLRPVFGAFDPEFLAMFDSFLKNGQIDVAPRKGKKGGAYSWSVGMLPTYILLNHVGNLDALETLAHEMGHAFHTAMSRKQSPLYRHYTTATAEVASTFFEQMASDEVEKQLSDKEKTIMLHNRLMGDITTIFVQIACFNFENELHERIRAEGQLSKEAMAALMNKHMKLLMGDAVTITEDDGYHYVQWSHIRRFFYVYTYAYGQLISKALYENYKKDKSYAKKVKQFLSAGGSMSPEDIFKSIGIDTSKTSFFEEGLKSIEKDIARLEKLAR